MAVSAFEDIEQFNRFSRGGHLRPQMGVLLKLVSMVAKTGNNQAHFPEVALALGC
jgi:hypothetical protein